MSEAAPPSKETARLESLRDYGILDTPPEQAFDDLARLASAICDTPVAMVSLVDANRQWFKSRIGTDTTETPREESFCQHTILGDDLMIVPDASADPRFADNPWVVGPKHIRFYAGAPLITPEGHALGALCVKDRVPRTLTPQQADALRALGRQVVSQLRLRRLAQQLETSERLLRSTLDTLTMRIAVLDQSGAILSANNSWEKAAAPQLAIGANYLTDCDNVGHARATAPNCPDGPDALRLAGGIRQVLEGATGLFTFEYPHQDRDGEPRWSVVRVKPLIEEHPRRVIVSHQDVTDRHLAADKLWHDSRHDALTGLPNRVLFAERVEHCIALARRGACDFAVLFMDLDRFKIINDSLGHAAGDKLLKTIAQRVSASLRPSDVLATSGAALPPRPPGAHELETVARMGGDEFTILLEHLKAPEDAARVAERILAAIAEPVEFGGHELLVTASIGIVPCNCGSTGGSITYESAKDLLRDADAALYKAKAAGKDRYVVFDQAMHAEVMTRMRLENDLRRAIQRNELELHYQPILDVASNGVVGLEALVRWRRNDVMMNPAQFIPVAEDTGMIVPIGAWVLREACRQLAAWRKSNPAMADLYVTVNVSRRQLNDGALVSTVERALADANLPASALGIEITESAMMEDPAAAEAAIVDLKSKLGVRISVDDFGTGYSSLSCLQRFPIDLLKIDRSFVQNVVRDQRDAAVMRTIVTLAHDLKMSVVAEGVETHDQAAFLSSSHCDLTQGYLFSRPLNAEAAERFLQAPRSPRGQPMAA